jgi:uridine kinase
MPRWTPLKADVLDSLAEEFLHNYATGRTLLAVDGIDGAGKTQFADALADALRGKGHAVIRASIDGVATDRIREALVGPFRRGEVLSPDLGDAAGVPAGSDATLIVVGGALDDPETRGLWNWSVWLDDTQGGRAAESSRRASASAIVDNSDWDHPRRVFADSC